MDNDCLAAPIPDEAGRLRALSRYQILDSPGEADYDDFTLLATLLCGTPIALISLVDAERQWFKSQHGLDVSQTARSVSFCAQAILSDDLLEVADTTRDTHFADNPLVTGAPHIRFYAGAPLITPDGFRLGTLSVIDTAPRQLTPTQRAGLMALARQVMRLFESRRSALEDKARANFQSAVLDSTEVAIVASDNQGLITSFNRGAEQMFGYQAAALIGHARADMLHEPALLTKRWQSSQQVPDDADFSVRMAALAGQSGLESEEWLMRRSDGSRFPVRLSITPISGASGASIGTLQVAQDISIAKAAQAAEARTAVFIRKIASQVPGVIYQFRRNPDGSSCFPYASERLSGLFQVDPADAARDGITVLQKLHPDDLLAVRETIEQSAANLTLWRAEFRIVLNDSSQRWVEGNAMPERLDDGALLWHGVFSDITARKAAELALRESQRFLSTLIDTLPVGVYTKSLCGTQRGQYLIWNPAQAQISGVPAAQVVGRSARQAFAPPVADAAEQHDAAVRTQRSAVELPDYRYLRPDDQLRRLRTRSVPIVGSSGEVEYVLGITEDMTESVRQQSALRIQQAEALAASDASPLGLFRADRLGQITYVNRKFEEIAGCAASACLGAQWLDAVHAQDRGLLSVAWRTAVSNKAGATTEFRFLHADQRDVWVRLVLAPVMLESEFGGMVGTVEDITARRTVRLALMASERRLRLVTDNLPAMVGYIDADVCYRFCSAGYRHILGLDPEAMLGKSLREVYGEHAYARMLPPIRAALDGKPMSFERFTRRDDAPTYLQCDYVPDIDDDGAVLGFYEMIVDITQRREAENRLAQSEQAMRMITENIPALVAHLDVNQRYLYVNARIGETFGKDTATMLGRRIEEEHPPQVFAQLKPHIAAVLAGSTVTFAGDTMVRGEQRFFESTYVPERDQGGNVVGFYAMTFDTTASRASEMRQAASEARLRTITDNLPVLISYIDQHLHIRFINATVNSWLGRTPEQTLNRHFSEIVSPATYHDRLPYLQRALGGERVEYESVAEAQGVTRHIQTIYIPDRVADGSVAGIYALSTDITVMKENEIKLLALARFDTLTGLPNRYQLNEKLRSALARAKRSGEHLAVLFLDIDRFKLINDQFGHGTGDDVLIEFARRLRAAVRETDTVARLAGDEFIVLLEGLALPAEPRLVAEKIIARFRVPMHLPSQHEILVSTSIGIAYCQQLPANPEELIVMADRALYRAKRAGRGGFSDEGSEPQATDDLSGR